MEKKTEISTICEKIKAIVSCLEMDINNNDIKEVEEDKRLIEYLIKRLEEKMTEQNN